MAYDGDCCITEDSMLKSSRILLSCAGPDKHHQMQNYLNACFVGI